MRRHVFLGPPQVSLTHVGHVCARAFQSDSVFTYALGLIVFVLVPYALLFVPVTIKGNKTEFAFFIFRLVLVFAFTLVGWIVTIVTLERLPREQVTTNAAKSEAKPLALSEEPAG